MDDFLKGKHDLSGDTLERLSQTGVNRRDFLKFCTGVAVSMGLPLATGPKIAEAVTSAKRPPVLWLSAQECTGCTETLLRASHPTLEKLILELVSLDYHETLNAGSGHQAEEARVKSMKENKGKYILVVDGSIPVKDNGIYCKIGGKTALSLIEEMGSQAAAVIAIGSCASWGGMPSADPNPTGATPAHEVLKNKGIKTPVVNIPGCPPNPITSCRQCFISLHSRNCRSWMIRQGPNLPMEGSSTKTVSADLTLTLAVLPLSLEMRAIERGIAFISWAARGQKHSQTVLFSFIMM